VGVLLEGLFLGPGRIAGVPSPLDGDPTIPFWWNHLASQANDLRRAIFSAIWLPAAEKGSAGFFSGEYDVFDDYDLRDKDQKGTIPTRSGTREQVKADTPQKSSDRSFLRSTVIRWALFTPNRTLSRSPEE
jgi:alpha-amylase